MGSMGMWQVMILGNIRYVSRTIAATAVETDEDVSNRIASRRCVISILISSSEIETTYSRYINGKCKDSMICRFFKDFAAHDTIEKKSVTFAGELNIQHDIYNTRCRWILFPRVQSRLSKADICLWSKV